MRGGLLIKYSPVSSDAEEEDDASESEGDDQEERPVAKKIVKKRTSNAGRRIIRGRIYDSVLGETCHWCRQKTVEDHVRCCRCPIRFCGLCLANRHGEAIREQMAEGVKWVCPKCRGGCGEGCKNCCNCGPCRKEQGLEPTGLLVYSARASGFNNVHDYLIYLKTHQTAEEIAKRKSGKNWIKAGGSGVLFEPRKRSFSQVEAGIEAPTSTQKKMRGALTGALLSMHLSQRVNEEDGDASTFQDTIKVEARTKREAADSVQVKVDDSQQSDLDAWKQDQAEPVNLAKAFNMERMNLEKQSSKQVQAESVSPAKTVKIEIMGQQKSAAVKEQQKQAQPPVNMVVQVKVETMDVTEASQPGEPANEQQKQAEATDVQAKVEEMDVAEKQGESVTEQQKQAEAPVNADVQVKVEEMDVDESSKPRQPANEQQTQAQVTDVLVKVQEMDVAKTTRQNGPVTEQQKQAEALVNPGVQVKMEEMDVEKSKQGEPPTEQQKQAEDVNKQYRQVEFVSEQQKQAVVQAVPNITLEPGAGRVVEVGRMDTDEHQEHKAGYQTEVVKANEVEGLTLETATDPAEKQAELREHVSASPCYGYLGQSSGELKSSLTTASASPLMHPKAEKFSKAGGTDTSEKLVHKIIQVKIEKMDNNMKADKEKQTKSNNGDKSGKEHKMSDDKEAEIRAKRSSRTIRRKALNDDSSEAEADSSSDSESEMDYHSSEDDDDDNDNDDDDEDEGDEETQEEGNQSSYAHLLASNQTDQTDDLVHTEAELLKHRQKFHASVKKGRMVHCSYAHLVVAAPRVKQEPIESFESDEDEDSRPTQESSITEQDSESDMDSKVEEGFLPLRDVAQLFSEQLQKELSKPFDANQLAAMLEEAKRRKAVLRHFETRQRTVSVETKHEAPSYLDHHPELAEKLGAANSDEEKLRLLRGFFFWLQHACNPGAFKPWASPKKSNADDCCEVDGPDCEITAVFVSVDEKRAARNLFRPSSAGGSCYESPRGQSFPADLAKVKIEPEN